MVPIIEQQRVVKRRKTHSFKHNNKSANFNTGFMNQFTQKPAHTRKKNSVSMFEAFTIAKRQKTRDSQLKTLRKSIPRVNVNNINKDNSGHKRSSGFSFSIPSLATMAVIAGIVIIALAAFNWEGFNIKTSDIYAVRPAEDTEAAQRTIQYAATGISAIFDKLSATAANEVSEENTSINNQNNPHGSLVTFEWEQYKVKKGDSVSAIAKKFDVSVGAIIASNNITNARKLQEGAILKIPNIDGIPYQIQKGDNLSKISASFNVPLDVILDINDIKSDNIRAGETLFIPGARMNDIDLRLSLGELFAYPLHNKFITSSYGMRKDPINGALSFHSGIDFRANTGTTVIAAMDGVVSVTSENWLYGKHIIISHSNGYKTMYAHLNAFSVKQGDRVVRGRKIGESGNTGHSTGPHLHFGVYDKSNRLVNPLELLN
jgi:murein DD-endopeptidase MepM/ murein hydrolase activator NlpD